MPKIIQFKIVRRFWRNTFSVYGLGEDGKMYQWEGVKLGWVLLRTISDNKKRRGIKK